MPSGGGLKYQTGAEVAHIVKAKGPRADAASGDYSKLLLDTSIVATVQEAAEAVSDEGVRAALQGSVQAAIVALQKRLGNGIRIYEKSMPKAA